MQQRLLSVVHSLRDRWNELDRSGKVKIIISVAAVVVALVAVVYFATRPKMTVILNGLTHAESMDGQTVLSDAGIYSEISKGELLVREEDADRATFEITNSDRTSINRADQTFTEAMNLITLGTTESTKREIMINQYERKLANSLTMFDGVAYAEVNLNIPPDDRYFIKSEQKATAGVILTTDKDITSKESQAIARYVCKSIKGLEMEDIQILNQNMEELYSGTKLSTDGYAELYELETIKKAEVEAAVKKFVYPMYDEVSVIVNLDIDNDKVIEEIRSYLNPNTVEGQNGFAENVFETSSSVTGSVDEAQPGINANDNATSDYQMGDDTATSGKTKESQINYLYNQILENREKAVGAVNLANSNISVRVIKNRVYYEEDLEASGQLEGTTWRQFQAGIDEYVPLASNEGLESLLANIKNGTGIANVSLIAFEHSQFVSKPVTETAFQNYVILAILALLILLLLYGFIKKTQQDEVTEIEPELSVEDLLVSTQLEEEKEAEAERLKEISFNQDSEAMKQIENFIAERPEAVAQLLRNWLNEEWE